MSAGKLKGIRTMLLGKLEMSLQEKSSLQAKEKEIRQDLSMRAMGQTRDIWFGLCKYPARSRL
jgi:hypothetical protein